MLHGQEFKIKAEKSSGCQWPLKSKRLLGHLLARLSQISTRLSFAYASAESGK